MQRTGGSHASDACSIHSTELDFRDVESNGGGLQPGLHHFQRTGQNSSHCAATSTAEFTRSGVKEGKIKNKVGHSMSGRNRKCSNSLLWFFWVKTEKRQIKTRGIYM